VIKPLIVAELGANHMGSLERAKAILSAAAKAGANAFKIQVWSPETMCIDPDYAIRDGAWKGRHMAQLYRECFTPWEWVSDLFNQAHELGLLPFASVFDAESVEFMNGLDVEIFKIASYEVVDLKLVRCVARTGKRAILSTGAATFSELRAALSQFRAIDNVTLLHCVSEYPSRPEQANLVTMRAMHKDFGCEVGLSDHSPGIGVAVAAAALGATVIEKHLTLRRADGGSDAGFSMEPEEFAAMCRAVRQAAVAYGEVSYVKEPSRLRRSLWVVKDAAAGDLVTADHIATARPALGLNCNQYSDVLGKRFTVDVKAGTPLTGVTASP